MDRLLSNAKQVVALFIKEANSLTICDMSVILNEIPLYPSVDRSDAVKGPRRRTILSFPTPPSLALKSASENWDIC